MPSPDAIYRFGPFEVRTRTHELYKHGIKLKLRPQLFQILHALLERSGDVVTRDELRQLLWSAETFVDFEQGLNTSIKELRGLLNDFAGEPRYIETLPKLGYRIIVPVESGLQPSSVVAARQEGMATDIPARTNKFPSRILPMPARRRWTIPVSIAAVVIVVLGASVQWLRYRVRPQASSVRAILAVLPFENLTGDSAQEYFSEGLTEEMITELGRIDPQSLGVIAHTSVMRYKKGSDLKRVARELGVDYVLEGSVQRDSEEVRIIAQLIRTKDQTQVWARQYDRQLTSLLSLQGEIAQEVSDEIELTLGKHPKSVAESSRVPVSPSSHEAYDLYLKGRYFWNKRGPYFQQAAEYFQKAIDKDPHYARAYAGLADTLALMSTWYQGSQNEFMPKARTAALKALQIDDTLAEAHTSLALIAENYDYDWQTAEKEYQRAILLDASYATAHQWYAECLSWQGRFNEALAESERARQLDPLSLIIATDHAAILYFSRQYDGAVAQAHAVLEMEPNFPRAYGIAISAEVQAGKFAEALADIERWRHAYGSNLDVWDAEVFTYGHWRRQAEARHALAKLKQSLRPSDPDAIPRLLLAYAATDQKDQAIGLLQRAYSEHSNAVLGLKVDPNYDPLRGDPRFQALLRQIGLAP